MHKNRNEGQSSNRKTIFYHSFIEVGVVKYFPWCFPPQLPRSLHMPLVWERSLGIVCVRKLSTKRQEQPRHNDPPQLMAAAHASNARSNRFFVQTMPPLLLQVCFTCRHLCFSFSQFLCLCLELICLATSGACSESGFSTEQLGQTLILTTSLLE